MSLMDHRPVVCSGCCRPITDRYYFVTVEMCWHVTCLRCCRCQGQLDTNVTCFAANGQVYCRDDYIRFDSRCLNFKLSSFYLKLVLLLLIDNCEIVKYLNMQSYTGLCTSSDCTVVWTMHCTSFSFTMILIGYQNINLFHTHRGESELDMKWIFTR